jgi:hypothetical protein
LLNAFKKFDLEKEKRKEMASEQFLDLYKKMVE